MLVDLDEAGDCTWKIALTLWLGARDAIAGCRVLLNWRELPDGKTPLSRPPGRNKLYTLEHTVEPFKMVSIIDHIT